MYVSSIIHTYIHACTYNHTIIPIISADFDAHIAAMGSFTGPFFSSTLWSTYTRTTYHTYIHIDIYIYTYIHIHTKTYIHTYIQQHMYTVPCPTLPPPYKFNILAGGSSI